MSAQVEIREVTRDYTLAGGLRRTVTLQALRGISLTVGRGEVVGIVGESGSGKSTLMRLLLGIEQPSTGTVAIEGRAIGSYDRLARARLIQPVFQDPYSSLNPRMSIGAIITAPLEVQRWGSAVARRERVRELMAAVGLPQRLAEVFPAQLSGGQRQRVAIARALAGEPKILICDEPTSALDVSVQAQILNLLVELQRRLDLTIVLVSHNLAVISHIADRVAVMYLGEIVEQGPTDEVFSAPRHPYTRELLNAVLLPEPDFRLPELNLKGEFPSPTAPPSGCAFHPRCSRASAACSTLPTPISLSGSHWALCHHPL
ncbi:ABC transporter ATP-binding protein [Labrys neptuniae]